MSAPPLLLVSSVLCGRVKALPHVVDLVSSFLIPPTIDSAVYNELQRVLKVYQRFRPHTVRAMDGAAGLGKQRNEGCSHVAFINAAVNGHVEVFKWLHSWYRRHANPANEIVEAAERGYLEIVDFLVPKLNRPQVEQALIAAAVHGHLPILEKLLKDQPFTYNLRKALVAGAANGHAQALLFMTKGGYCDGHRNHYPAMVSAAQGGHAEALEVLIDRSDQYMIAESLKLAARDGHQDVVRLLLKKEKPDKRDVAHALEIAAKADQFEALKLLLDNFIGSESVETETPASAKSHVDRAFLSAVEDGRMNAVKILVSAFSRPISDALVVAGLHYQVGVLDFLLDYCEAQISKDRSYNENVAGVAQTAAEGRNIEMAKLLAAKCKGMNTSCALSVAIGNDDLEMLKILVAESNSTSIEDALVAAAVVKSEQLLEIILEYSNTHVVRQAAEKAVIRVESRGTSPLSKVLLARCDVDAHCRVFDKAAGQGLVGLVQLLLGKMNQPSVRCAMISAAMSGETGVVEVLKEKSDSTGIKCAFEMAVLRGHVGIVDLLRSQCDTDSIEFAMTAGDAEVVRLVHNKRARLQ